MKRRDEHIGSRVRKRRGEKGSGRAQEGGEWLLPGASRKAAVTHDDANVASSAGGLSHDCNFLRTPAAELLH